ncbi:hypothetical protein N665_1221s0002 [Sinapis alba]|nr:hypothetical protein N665_1221s0002 [Sinapis alba]
MRNYAGNSTISETPQNHQGRRNRESCTNGCDHTSTNAPDPIRTPQLSVLGREYTISETPQNHQVKRGWARVVLGWVTSREVLVLHPFLFFFFNWKTSQHRNPKTFEP